LIAHDEHARWANAAVLDAKPGDREIVPPIQYAKWMGVTLSSSSVAQWKRIAAGRRPRTQTQALDDRHRTRTST
jgi:hypothetical protein